ncbi:hypothetical protein R4Z10_11810 [Niallia sp. XMNu-256]
MNENYESKNEQNTHSLQDEAMERANQTFNKIKQEVQDMIHENGQAENME